jgi:hypothetical protein
MRSTTPNSAFGVHEITNSILVSRAWRMRFMVRFLLCSPAFCSFAPFPLLLVAPAEAFPDSDEAAATAVDQYRVEQKIVRSEDPQAKLSSGELMASIEGRLQLVAKLGSELRQAIVSVFKALWRGQVVPGDVRTLLQWIPLISNRFEVWKESAA